MTNENKLDKFWSWSCQIRSSGINVLKIPQTPDFCELLLGGLCGISLITDHFKHTMENENRCEHSRRTYKLIFATCKTSVMLPLKKM